MMDDMEQMIKEKLLESLIEKMSDGHDDRMKPKGLAVEVAAPDKKHLAKGLDDAKGELGNIPEPSEEPKSEEDDEHRLMQLLAEDEDEEKKV